MEVLSTHRKFVIPNKWDKHLAPWFSEKCTTTRRTFRTAQKRFGKKHAQTVSALKTFVDKCKASRAQMQFQLPNMLKQRPKQFWGMLKSKATKDLAMPMLDFVKFNESIFYDLSITTDTFTPLSKRGL